MNPVTTLAPKAIPALPAADLEIAKGFARASKAAATRHAYQKDFARFTAWCEERHLPAIPAAPETVAAFLAAEAAGGSLSEIETTVAMTAKDTAATFEAAGKAARGFRSAGRS